MLLLIYGIQIRKQFIWRMSVFPEVDEWFWKNHENIGSFFVVEPLMPPDRAQLLLSELNRQPEKLCSLSESRDHFQISVSPSLPRTQFNQINSYISTEEQLLHFANVMEGRSLSVFEISKLLFSHNQMKICENWQPLVQLAYLRGHVKYDSGISSTKVRRRFFWTNARTSILRCNRCGADSGEMHVSYCLSCQKDCSYCMRCLQMGKIRQCSLLVIGVAANPQTQVNKRVKIDPSDWLDSLTPIQRSATEKVIRFLDQSDDSFLLWAVTGAGKTEMIYPIIAELMSRQKKAAIVTPRKDVVLELLPRICRAFPDLQIGALYGGSESIWGKYETLLATTHQLIRFQSAFDVIVIDEIDAFPYHNNPMLEFAVRKALRPEGKFIWLSATPPQSMIRRIKQKKLSHAIVASRFHGHPLPLPHFHYMHTLARQFRDNQLSSKLLLLIQQSLHRGANLFLFVPKIAHVEPLVRLLRRALPVQVAGTSSQDAARMQTVESFRGNSTKILVTTSILERGVTVPFSDVFVLDSDNEQFDSRALIQMAGRAGRSAQDPNGRVWFFAANWTRSQKQAVKEIRTMNRLAGFR